MPQMPIELTPDQIKEMVNERILELNRVRATTQNAEDALSLTQYKEQEEAHKRMASELLARPIDTASQAFMLMAREVRLLRSSLLRAADEVETGMGLNVESADRYRSIAKGVYI